MHGISLFDLAKKLNGAVLGNGDCVIFGVETLENASIRDLSFLSKEGYQRYLPLLRRTEAGCVLVDKAKKCELEALNLKANLLFVDNPSEAFQKGLELFCKASPATSFSGIHPTSVIHPEAALSKGVSIGPYAVIEAGASIGKDTQVLAHSYIGPNAKIGENCLLFSHSVVREGCILHNRIILQPGCVIGSCGFGYLTSEKGEHTKLSQLGIVVLEDDVEIGANTTIDRARFQETRIKKGTKIDNLCQIAHNVSIGEGNLIVSQTGIAGSTTTGAFCVFAGQSASVGHLKIAPKTTLAARGAFSKSIEEPGGIYNGAPAIPIKEHNRIKAHLRRLDGYVKRIGELEHKIKALEEAKVSI